jgi:alkaline phosphatase D
MFEGKMMPEQRRLSRRSFLSQLGAVGAGTLAASSAIPRVLAQGNGPAVVTPDAIRPAIRYGVASGDVTSSAAIIWSRTDRPSRMLVEYATTESFANAQRVQGPAALAVDDFTARIDLRDLPPGQDIFYGVLFQDLSDPKRLSVPAVGFFRTASAERRDLTFVWSGDTAGQGWGINPEWGGMKIYEQIRRHHPDFFIHCGDYIYADNPLEAEVKLEDGTIWKNVTIPEKAKVAETLAEFRGNYVYNLMDEHVRRCNAAVAQLVRWDDHETTNNWFPGGVIDKRNRRFAEYTIKSHDLLSAHARRAFLWEFVAGPLHAGIFGPNTIDNTFGLQIRFTNIPEGTKPNTPPTAGLQFFGLVNIDGKSDGITVSLRNLQGERIYRLELAPEV